MADSHRPISVKAARAAFTNRGYTLMHDLSPRPLGVMQSDGIQIPGRAFPAGSLWVYANSYWALRALRSSPKFFRSPYTYRVEISS